MRSRIALALLPALALAGPATAAHAAGSLFLVEVSTGLSEPTASRGDIGLTYGLTTGLTWKLTNFPLRFHLLGTLVGRNAHTSGRIGDLLTTSERQDVDLYGSLRLALPIVGGLRVYGEGGLGVRWSAQTLNRAGLAALDASASTPIAVGAVGVQYRLMEALSLGLRGEVVGATSHDDVFSAITGDGYDAERLSLLVQLGFHF
jgi:hypothetical protein